MLRNLGLPFCPTTLNLFLSCLFCSSITDNFNTPINFLFKPHFIVRKSIAGVLRFDLFVYSC